MIQKTYPSKFIILLPAVISCMVYIGATIHQYHAAPYWDCFKYIRLYIGCAALASCLLLAVIYKSLIYKLWERIQQICASQSTFKQSVIFRLLLLVIFFGFSFLGIQIDGSSLFHGKGEGFNFSLSALLIWLIYLVDGILFAFLCRSLRKNSHMVFPIFLLCIVAVRVSYQAFLYSDFLHYPSYCKDAAPGSIPSKVCSALGPDADILVNAGRGAYINLYAISERLLVPEQDFHGNPLDADTIIGICQHELGHRKHHHVTILSIMTIVGSLMPAVGAHIFMECPSVFAAVVGPHADVVPIVAYTMAETISSILRSYLMPLKLQLSRNFEYQADDNIGERYRALVLNYLKGAFDDSKVTPIFRFLRLQHPSTADRAARMNLQI